MESMLHFKRSYPGDQPKPAPDNLMKQSEVPGLTRMPKSFEAAHPKVAPAHAVDTAATETKAAIDSAVNR